LERLRELNPELRFTFNNVALSDAEGVLPIAFNPERDSRNATLVPGKQFGESRNVPARRLDEYIRARIASREKSKSSRSMSRVSSIQFFGDSAVFFRKRPSDPRPSARSSPWELNKLGATMDDFEQYMSGFGYRAHAITQEDTPIPMGDLREMEILVFSV
jgi:hypothetical protein